VFGANGTSEPPAALRSKAGNDTHNRLFGPVDSHPQSASLNRMKSNIPFGVVAPGSELEQSFKSTSLKSAVTENGQHEMLSTPKGESLSTVCTQPSRNFLGYLSRTVPLLLQNRTNCFTGHRKPYLHRVLKKITFSPSAVTPEYL
jgi:hypothetical protein